jgi:carboxyl-terminal processing protease
LLASFWLSTLRAQGTDTGLFNEVFEAVWQAVRDKFYDPRTRGIDWLQVREEFAPRVSLCTSRTQLLSLLREMLGRLHNSHIFLYSREEWDLRQNILPLNFERSSGELFIRNCLRVKGEDAPTDLQFGDQILSVDGVAAQNLRPISLANLQDVTQNPNFGTAGSVAELRIRRGSKIIDVKARRVKRPSEIDSLLIEYKASGVAVLRMFTLDSSELPEPRLTEIFRSLQSAKGLVIDLRNCVGGDPKVSSFIAGAILRERRRLFTEIPRPGGGQPETTQYSDADAPPYRGKVAILTNSNTESQPEVLAAVCKEYACARLIGERTAGAFNGFTVAIALPDRFARFALPYTRGVSPSGLDYEGVGVTPDETVTNIPQDFHHRRDRPLVRAIKYVA